jgi:hypothetical protein
MYSERTGVPFLRNQPCPIIAGTADGNFRFVVILAMLLRRWLLRMRKTKPVLSQWTAARITPSLKGAISVAFRLSAERHIRITLKTQLMTLSNRYTNKHGNFDSTI